MKWVKVINNEESFFRFRPPFKHQQQSPGNRNIEKIIQRHMTTKKAS